MNPFNFLLSQAANLGQPVPQDMNPDEMVMNPTAPPVAQPEDEEDIFVTGKRLPGMEAREIETMDAPFMGNKGYIEEVNASMAEAPEHKGMFGVKGTLRDVLGILGDSFLVQSGNQRLYHPKRQLERESDALIGSTNSPEAMMAAIERMASVNPERALEMAKENNGVIDAARRAEAAAQKAQLDAFDQGMTAYGQMAGAATAETWPSIRKVLLKIQQDHNLGPEFDVPEEFNPGWAKAYQYGGMKTNQQVSSAQRDTQLGINQGNLDERVRSNKEREEDSDQRIATGKQNANTNSARAAETRRANRVREGQRQQTIDQGGRGGRRGGPRQPRSGPSRPKGNIKIERIN